MGVMINLWLSREQLHEHVAENQTCYFLTKEEPKKTELQATIHPKKAIVFSCGDEAWEVFGLKPGESIELEAEVFKEL